MLLPQITMTVEQQYARHWLAGLPRPPQKEVHDFYEIFTFSMQMLPSVNNRTTRGTHTVRASYREQELTEVGRIAAQRDAVGWSVSDSDAYLIVYTLTFESERADIHNPVKPTCDLFGQGRYDWVGSGHKRHKEWINHAWVIWNDNRVWDERLVRVVEGRRAAHWATVSIVKCDRTQLHRINPHILLAELGQRFDPRPRETPPPLVSLLGERDQKQQQCKEQQPKEHKEKKKKNHLKVTPRTTAPRPPEREHHV